MLLVRSESRCRFRPFRKTRRCILVRTVLSPRNNEPTKLWKLETVSSRKRLLNHLVNGVAGRKVTRELTNRNMKKRAVRHALDTDDTYPIDQVQIFFWVHLNCVIWKGERCDTRWTRTGHVKCPIHQNAFTNFTSKYSSGFNLIVVRVRQNSFCKLKRTSSFLVSSSYKINGLSWIGIFLDKNYLMIHGSFQKLSKVIWISANANLGHFNSYLQYGRGEN